MTQSSQAALKALAEPRRVAMLRLVRDRPRSVGEIAGHFEDITQQAVSQHLRELREAGLVAVHKDGQRRMYMLRPGGNRGPRVVPARPLAVRPRSAQAGRRGRRRLRRAGRPRRWRKVARWSSTYAAVPGPAAGSASARRKPPALRLQRAIGNRATARLLRAGHGDRGRCARRRGRAARFDHARPSTRGA